MSRLQAGEVNKAISTALAGQVVGAFVDGNRRQDIVVRMPEKLRENEDEINKLPVRVGDTLLPLGGLVESQTQVSSRSSATAGSGARR